MEGDVGEEPKPPWDGDGEGSVVPPCDGVGTYPPLPPPWDGVPVEPPCDGVTGVMLPPPIPGNERGSIPGTQSGFLTSSPAAVQRYHTHKD